MTAAVAPEPGDVQLSSHVTLLRGAANGKYPDGNSLVVSGSDSVVIVDPSLTVHRRVIVPGAVDRDNEGERHSNGNAGPIGGAEMVAAGAGMCHALERAISASKGTKDCVRRAIEAWIPTYLINSDAAEPKRLLAGDARLR